MESLNDKQEMFCREYLKDLNATQAAVRAGYSKRSAYNQGSQLLTKRTVQERIATLKAKRIEKTEADADHVLKRLIEIDMLDIADILDDEGNIKPMSMWSEAWRRSIDSFDISVKTSGGTSSYIKSIKLPNKLKILELLSKHLDVSAVKENQESAKKEGINFIIEVTDPKTKDEIEYLVDRLG